MADTPAISGAVQPLYTAADAVNPPIITQLPDGTILTRGAGRVRNRQEKDETFNTYDPVYFEDRSFGLMVEDHTPTGTQLIRTTYLPIAKPGTGNLITNWRAWKQEGNSGAFQVNTMMTAAATTPLPLTAAAAATEAYDTKSAPQGRSLAPGGNLEFELGIFFDPAALTTPGSRSSYHSDTFRYVIGKGGFTPNNTDYPAAPGPVPEARLGGDTTTTWLYSEPELSFSQMALNIQHENVQNFLEGRRLFNTDFVTGEHSGQPGPAFAAHVGKAGPLMNSTACQNCHTHNGSGEPLVGSLSQASSLVLKLYGAGELGRQLRLQQGSASVSGSQQATVTLPDSTVVALTRPVYTVMSNSGDASHYSPRIAPQLVGLGLLEAIDEPTILGLADRLDCDQNDISGRPSYVPDSTSGKLQLGRLGWKAESTSLSWQVSQDLALGMGVGNSLFPDQGQELAEIDVIKLVTYAALLGVHPQRDHVAPEVVRGQELFTTVGCANCHVTKLVTGSNHPFAELRNQTIQPFTDLLLHDMGPELTDESGVPAPDQASSPPSASEWRTPPLWGIGLRTTVNGHDALLHDGRAASVLEAVLWHGGEAHTAVAGFVQLSAADRDALVAFVKSL